MTASERRERNEKNMKLITLDFETYYDDVYGLNKLTTEEYIRDPRFEAILMGYKVDDGHKGYVVGRAAIQTMLDSLDVENNAALCHHAHFDGLIMSHHFGTKPKVWFDTLSMARAIHGTEVGGSLAKLLTHYQVGVEKGDYVMQAKGRHLADFGDVTCSDMLMHYGRYCCDDVEGTYRIFQRMLPDFNKAELKQIDMSIRMFTEPQLLLDEQMLRDYAQTIQADKLTLLFEAGVTLDEVMSNEKFAEALQRLGVDPPRKISLTTGKATWAFAKTDKGLQELQEHEDDRVQTLVAARLGNKTTINETRAIRMADMATRGPACMYYKYAGAMQTMRWSGGDKLNWQNLGRKGALRDSIYAPEGQALVVVDSRNIESRVLDWLAMQEDMLEVYHKFDRGEGPDVYCVMASRLFQREITLADTVERQTGKHTKLGCFAADTLVFSSRGILRLDELTTTDTVWDGVEWVAHQGVVYQGRQQTLQLARTRATPDHLVLTEGGWREWREVHTSRGLFQSALSLGSSLLPDTKTVEEATSPFARVRVGRRADPLKATCEQAGQQDATHVLTLQPTPSGTGNTRRPWTAMNIARAYLIGWRLLLDAAIRQATYSIKATARGALQCILYGVPIARPSCGTCNVLSGGTTQRSTWTERTRTGITRPATYASAVDHKTPRISAASTCFPPESASWRNVYDIAHAGPRNRFMILTADGPVIVHNCGYQMGPDKFKETARIIGGLVLTSEQAQNAVGTYRSAHPMVVQLWNRAQNSLQALAAGPDGDKHLDSRGLLVLEKGGILLPNNLRIKFPGLSFDTAVKWSFAGRNGSDRIHLYGGKIVENVVQALARIVVMDQIVAVSKRYKAVMTTHDEGVFLVPEERADEALEYALTCLSTPPTWAPDLPVAASGGIAVRYGEVIK